MTLVSPAQSRPSRPALAPQPVPLGRPFVRGKNFARGTGKLHIRGVTYGPFAPNAHGIQFPAPEVVRYDFACMRQAGFNALRTYLVPPPWLFEVAAENDLLLFLDVPWRKHVCFFDSDAARQEARDAMRQAAHVGRAHSNLLAY